MEQRSVQLVIELVPGMRNKEAVLGGAPCDFLAWHLIEEQAGGQAATTLT